MSARISSDFYSPSKRMATLYKNVHRWKWLEFSLRGNGFYSEGIFGV